MQYQTRQESTIRVSFFDLPVSSKSHICTGYSNEIKAYMNSGFPVFTVFCFFFYRKICGGPTYLKGNINMCLPILENTTAYVKKVVKSLLWLQRKLHVSS